MNEKEEKRTSFYEGLQLFGVALLVIIFILSILPIYILVGLWCELRYQDSDEDSWRAYDKTWSFSLIAWWAIYGFIPRLVMRIRTNFNRATPCY